MNEIVVNRALVAACGLYCGACGAYRKGRCPGCKENIKAKWCKIRTCCSQRSFTSCAECKEFPDPNDCAKFNNMIGRILGVVLNSNRRACILKIRELGLDGFAAHMAKTGRPTLPRR